MTEKGKENRKIKWGQNGIITMHTTKKHSARKDNKEDGSSAGIVASDNGSAIISHALRKLLGLIKQGVYSIASIISTNTSFRYENRLKLVLSLDRYVARSRTWSLSLCYLYKLDGHRCSTVWIRHSHSKRCVPTWHSKTMY